LNILDLAEQYYIITFGVVLGIGLLQGAILGRGIRSRFPSMKKHARAVSGVLLVLFLVNAISSILKFAEPAKLTLSTLTIPTSTEEIFSLIMNLLGVNAGLWTVIGTFITIVLFIFLKFADIHQIARYFIFTISCIVLIVALLGKFTDFIPTSFQITLYAFYQVGITLGIFFITRRRESDVLSEIK